MYFEKDEENRKVILIGEGYKNPDTLFLGYLKGALELTDAIVNNIYINTNGRIITDEILKVVDFVIGEKPLIVGFSMNDDNSATMLLIFARLLRKRGYKGHITAGGEFATVAREWLLSTYEWIDSVLKFAAEVPLTGLYRRLKDGTPIDKIAGLTLRGVDEIPAPVGDPLPLQIFASRDHFNKIAGYNGAQINASRGCTGSCTYCTSSTIKRLEYREAKALKMSKTAKINCNIGKAKTRTIDTICDEISLLWHQQKVRYFYFIDKQLLADNENHAIDFLESLKSGIEARGVKYFRFGLILKDENLTENIIDKAVETGLVNCFVNLEFGTKDEGLLFKRKIDHENTLKMIKKLEHSDVSISSKVILIHPYSTLESIKRSLLLINSIDYISLELTSMRVLYKTTLYNNLKKAGRLLGDPFGYSYVFEDKRVERFSKIYSKLRNDSFQNFGLSLKIKNILINIAMIQTLYGNTEVKLIERELKILQKSLNRVYIEAFEEGFNIAKNNLQDSEIEKLVQSAKCKSLKLLSKIQNFEFLTDDAVKKSELSNDVLIKNYSFVAAHKNSVVNNF